MLTLLKKLFARAVRQTEPTRPALETLEAREVPAGVTASLNEAGVLTVTGTAGADTIRVHQFNNRISISGVIIPGSVTSTTKTVDGITIEDIIIKTGVEASKVKKIVVNAGGGDDLIDLDSNSYTSSQKIYIAATVNGGSGNDTIHGTMAGDTIDGGTGNDKIWGHGGDDSITATVGEDRVVGGKGNDMLFANLNMKSLESAQSGRLFFSDGFTAGDGTDTVKVTLDLKSFGDRLLTPALSKVRSAISVFDPVLNMLDQKVPALSKYDGNLTYGSILRAAKPELGKFLDSIKTIRNLSTGVYLSSSIELGQFRMVINGSVPTIQTIVANPLSKITNSVLTAARNIGVRFSLLEDPQSAMRLMMGQNVDLMTMRLVMPSISAGMNKTYSMPTGIPGINATVGFGGNVWASASATFAVTTNGIWGGDVLKAFTIREASATVGGKLYVKGGVSAGIPGVFEIASVKGYGEVNGSINFNLNGGSLASSGRIGYDIGIELGYKGWEGTDHHKSVGNKYIGYKDIVWTTYGWVNHTHRKSFGSGSFTF